MLVAVHTMDRELDRYKWTTFAAMGTSPSYWIVLIILIITVTMVMTPVSSVLVSNKLVIYLYLIYCLCSSTTQPTASMYRWSLQFNRYQCTLASTTRTEWRYHELSCYIYGNIISWMCWLWSIVKTTSCRQHTDRWVTTGAGQPAESYSIQLLNHSWECSWTQPT